MYWKFYIVTLLLTWLTAFLNPASSVPMITIGVCLLAVAVYELRKNSQHTLFEVGVWPHPKMFKKLTGKYQLVETKSLQSKMRLSIKYAYKSGLIFVESRNKTNVLQLNNRVGAALYEKELKTEDGEDVVFEVYREFLTKLGAESTDIDKNKYPFIVGYMSSYTKTQREKIFELPEYVYNRGWQQLSGYKFKPKHLEELYNELDLEEISVGKYNNYTRSGYFVYKITNHQN